MTVFVGISVGGRDVYVAVRVGVFGITVRVGVVGRIGIDCVGNGGGGERFAHEPSPRKYRIDSPSKRDLLSLTGTLSFIFHLRPNPRLRIEK